MIRLACVLIVFLLSGCMLFGGGDELRRMPLEELGPTVRFVERQPVTVIQSDIEAVDASQVISSYERLMQSPHAEVRRQATRRLADLNMRLAEERDILLSDGAPIEQIPPAIAQASYNKASELYQRVLDEYPRQADDANIRYQLARALAMQGNDDASLAQMDELSSIHETTNELAEIEFRRGEAYFLRQNYVAANEAYEKVLALGDANEFYEKALYKNGWSLFKRFQYDVALENFFPVFEILNNNDDLADDLESVQEELIADTKRAISLSFYNLDGAESVKAYFADKSDKPYQDIVYQALADLYLSQRRFQDAANTFTAFVETQPMHPKAAFFQLQVIDAHIAGGFNSLVLPAKEDFLQKFGVKSRYWTVASSELKATLEPNLLSNLEEVSSFYHAKAQENKNRDDYLVAAGWYSHFLDLLDDELRVAPYHFLMAEALFDAQEYKAAYLEFDTLAYEYRIHEKRESAAYNLLLALQALESSTDASDNSYAEKITDYSLLYAATFPESQRSPELVNRVMEEYVVAENLTQAIRTAEYLLTFDSALATQRDRAQIIIANGLFDLKHYQYAEQAITQVLTSVSLTTEQRMGFRERRAESIYQQAEAFKQQQLFSEAIAEYQRMVSVEPNSQIRVNAELDAAVLLMQLNRWQEAKVALEGFRGRFSTHPLAEGLDERLALVYEKLEAWGDAAGAYRRIAANSADPEEQRDIQWYIADLYIKAGQTGQAIQAYADYFNRFPKPLPQAMEAASKLVALYQDLNNESQVDAWRKRIVQTYERSGAENTDRTRYLAAQSAFFLAEPYFEDYLSLKLTLPLATSLQRKRTAMDRALAAYGDIAKYQVAEFTTASTHRVGQLYLTLARDIINSERPQGMSEEESEEYGFLIEDQAFPIEERAIDIFVSNANRVLNQVYDDWVKKSFAELAKLQPARYNKQEQVEVWIGGSNE